MKRQFLQMQPFQNSRYPSGQPVAKTEWSPATDAQPRQPGVQSGQSGVPSARQLEPAAYRPGTGLLSGWKSAQANTAGTTTNRKPQDASLARQESVGYMDQPITRDPITGPTLHPHVMQPQAFSGDQPSTYQKLAQAEIPMTPPSLPYVNYNGGGYNKGNSNGRGGLFAYAAQRSPQPAMPVMPAVIPAAMPVVQPPPAQPFRMQNMAPIATMAPAPMSPLAPNPQRLDPFGKPIIPGPQGDVWAPWSPEPSDGYPGYRPPSGPGGPNSGGPGGGGPPPRFNAKRRKKRRVPIWARVVLALLVLVLIALGGGTYYYEANFAQPISKITGQQVSRLRGETNPNQNRSGSGDILSGGRINILLLGSDTDEKFQGTYLAQTDIVVTIDPKTNYVAMLSIPRDTWLNAAGGAGMMKLDQAYGRGGVALSRATIEQDFGIPINYYAWVGLNGFIKVVDTVNGVDLDAIHPVTDDAYPDDTGANKSQYDNGYKRLYIAPGPQHMNGMVGLEYVRSRHADLVGDFGRSQRQQQLLSALKLKLNNSSIIGELPQLASDLNGYVTTDMQLTDVFKLMNFARTLNQNQIHQVVLANQYSRTVGNYPTAYGPQDIVVLNCAEVLPAISSMFALGDQARCDTGISSTGTPTATAVATMSQPLSTVSSAIASATTADSAWQIAEQMTAVNGMSYSDGTSSMYGVRSLIDLLCLTVFETPTGMQA